MAGHWAQTIDYRRKMKWYRVFLAGRASETEIAAHGIDFVVLAGQNPYDFPEVFVTATLRVAHVPRKGQFQP